MVPITNVGASSPKAREEWVFPTLLVLQYFPFFFWWPGQIIVTQGVGVIFLIFEVWASCVKRPLHWGHEKKHNKIWVASKDSKCSILVALNASGSLVQI
jgi:hypothetical protein